MTRPNLPVSLDLGYWWSNSTGNLPVPLGINVASTRTMSIAQIKQFSDLFTKSIKYGLDNIDGALEYAMQFGRGQSKETIRKFVEMYVNNLTLDMGEEGKKALKEMFEMAKDRKMLESEIQIEVV